MFTHLLIGGHVDGGWQGLYEYLRLGRRLRSDAIVQLMLDFLTSAKTASESAGIQLTSMVVDTGAGLQVPQTPIQKTFTDILELDESRFDGLTE